jgi:hypothetical protein
VVTPQAVVRDDSDKDFWAAASKVAAQYDDPSPMKSPSPTQDDFWLKHKQVQNFPLGKSCIILFDIDD